MPLVEIKPPVFDVELDLRYATANNITGAALYRQARGLLHPLAADALQRAITEAARMDLRLRLFDLYRPVEAQWMLWHYCPDPAFVADPRIGSAHGRGIAVDLTLQTRAGTMLDMGTDFDAFGPAAGHLAEAVCAAASQNRALLAGIMSLAGFQPYAAEWWHYQLPAAHLYPLLTDAAAGAEMIASKG
jgi:zinc D-Ala-D-Ala dipeptidase